MSLHGRLAALGLLVCALTANAAPKITIAPITGDKKSQVASQISAALCRTYTCVPSSRVFTKKKPDWNKMKSAQVSGLLVGGVAKAKSGKGKEVQLSWLDKPGKAAQSWSFPLTSAGKLTSSSVQTLSADVGNLASGGGAAAVGAVGAIAAGGADTLATTPQTTGPASSSSAAGALAASAALAGTQAEPLPLPVTPTPPAPGEKSLADTPVAVDAGASQGYEAPRHQWRFAVELGADLLNRNLSYSNVGAGSILRPYSVGLFFAPHARLELFPIAFFSDGFFAGIGIFGDYAMSVGLKSKFQDTTDTFEKGSTYNRWQAGIEWRMRFWSDSDFAIVPFFAYGKQKFVTDGDPSGSGFNGLPQFSLSGYKFGLRLDIPVSSGFWIIVGGDYVIWSTKDLPVQDQSGVNSVTFTGSAKAIEAELGFHIHLAGPLALRVFGIYQSTSFTFDEGQAEAAGSATDRYLGGRVMLRLQF
ncbi:MAG TPA: hypothetical protein VFD38_00310 [Myxococcaceae bacterium]|nr:hypothetical protein [Myxococcaceae bacterium]